MKKFTVIFIFVLTFFGNLSFGAIRLQLKPGAGFYTDGMNYSAGAGLRTDLSGISEGLFTGIGGYYSAVLNSTDPDFNGFGGGLEIGYRFSIAGFLDISPCFLIGASYLHFGNSLTNFDQPGLLLNPSITAEIPIWNWMALGLTFDYRYIPLELPGGNYNLNELNTMVSLIFIFGAQTENRNESQTEKLSSDLNKILESNKIQASIIEENRDDINLNIPDVLFEINSEVIHPEFMDTLKSIAEMAKKYPGFTILIEGHSDDRGDADYNRKLSENRAKNVSFVFLGAGIPSAKITYKGIGKDKPIAPNTSAESRAKNRRVEIRFIRNK